ncbi:MAG: hypothetical protein UT29_C0002G0013 [Candidatus Yanofskybacteria bacterium GW2011_GWA1_39_13]|uniref:Uncharacterized protein n=1 Tax=Yanofskybacteria sp. (strain GW2011_GWA1_39_13) TaxID=1619019 RepID=A0A0G0MPT4_YANXG|nr:MAG: hypothetical protein UT29_C0002G0013 [Candidatus Yanofskybacteria bacterium GW2011_GWA1_39_13]
MNINKHIYVITGVVILVLAGYFYFIQTNNQEVVESQEMGADTSESLSINPKEILKYDPNAPAWMQDAESCTKVREKIFCKLKGE